MLNLFRRKGKTDPPLNDNCYVYIDAKAYMKRGNEIVCCDFKSRGGEGYVWRVITDFGDGNNEACRALYALALLEGAIDARSYGKPFHGLSLN
jgi:hypothetical protein